MKKFLAVSLLALGLVGCAAYQPPEWSAGSLQQDAEYQPFLKDGSGILKGQAFLTQSGGGVVRAAGETVTLDPVTTLGQEWWAKAGIIYAHRNQVPPSPAFVKARRETVANAEGNFEFKNLPAGKYYVRTKVTWEVPSPYIPTQGGLVGRMIEISEGKTTEVILNQFAR